jgi:Rrf2 family cysteine metabolism transcriptional repressor
MIGTTKSEYALLALIRLAHVGASGMSVREIAASENISVKYLERVMTTLKNHGYVASTIGARGGFVLSKSPDEIACGEIVRVFDKKAGQVNRTNGKDKGSGVTDLLHRTQAAIGDVLDKTMIADLLPKTDDLNAAETVRTYLTECQSGYMFHI